MLFFIYPMAVLQACFLPPVPAKVAADPRKQAESCRPVD
jgi:hypothetical protein